MTSSQFSLQQIRFLKLIQKTNKNTNLKGSSKQKWKINSESWNANVPCVAGCEAEVRGNEEEQAGVRFRGPVAGTLAGCRALWPSGQAPAWVRRLLGVAGWPRRRPEGFGRSVPGAPCAWVRPRRAREGRSCSSGAKASSRRCAC